MSHCKQCGAEFLQNCDRHIYCSERCCDTAANERQMAKYIAKHGELTARPCIHCGNEYTPKRRDARFCSKRCNADYILENPTGYISDPDHWAVTTPYFPAGGHAFDGWVSKCLTGAAHA